MDGFGFDWNGDGPVSSHETITTFAFGRMLKIQREHQRLRKQLIELQNHDETISVVASIALGYGHVT